MKRALIVLFTGVLMFLVSFVWAADSKLVEAAKREKERRAKIKSESVRTITNQDIEEFKKKNKNTSGVESTSTETDEGTVEEILPEVQNIDEQEAMWRKKYQDAAGRVEQAQKNVEDLQSQFNAALGAYNNNSNAGQLAMWQELDKLRAELDAAKQKLSAAEEGMVNLEDEARQEQVPPGWVRE